MTFRNTKRSWGSLSRTLHWIIVLLIINQWVIAVRADALPKGPALIAALWWHKSFGITILMLAVVRLVWRWMNPVPDLTAETRPWERMLARVSHFLLYALLFAIPLSGWMMSSARNFPVSWFGVLQLPDLVGANPQLYERLHALHGQLFAALVVVAALHIAGALKHHFIDRNDVLRRMLPFGRPREGND
jgi:cytochrome b561